MAQGGIRGVRAQIAHVEREAMREHDGAVRTAVGAPRKVRGQAIDPGEWIAGADGLPPDCPVKTLGREGSLLHMIDANGQLATVEPGQFGQATIQALFHNHQEYLYWAWPRHSKPKDGQPKIEGWRAEKVRETLYAAAGRQPLFSADGHVRGRGAWRELDGGLVYHSGDALWRVSGGRLVQSRPGLVGREFYEMLAAIPAPWPEPVEGSDNPAPGLLEALRSWHWERPLVDPVLMLGWIGVGWLAGALDWRPSAYVTGDRATGKSTMLDLVKATLGDAMLRTANTTESGISQSLRHDARAVGVDEFEAEAENARARAIMNLAKIAASGDTKLRGSSDHKAVSFTLRSPFLFSSINMVPMRPEDLSRFALFRMRPLHDKKDRLTRPPALPAPADELGPMLLRRMMDGWARYPAAYDAYAVALAAGGHGDRGQKTFGTLLACADLLLGADGAERAGVPMVDNIGEWSHLLAAADMQEVSDQAENWRRCITHLLTVSVEAWRNRMVQTVGQLLDKMREDVTDDYSLASANDALAQCGLAVKPDLDGALDYWLAVPNDSPLVSRLFWGTTWVGAPGASVWKSALRQGPPDVCVTAQDRNRVRINGVQQRCTLVRLRALEG